MADEGFGITISFATGFFAEITNASWDGLERADIDTSHANSPDGYMSFQPSDLRNPGELTVELNFDPDVEPPIEAPPETVTVTFPVPPGGNTAATWACTGYLKSMSAAVPYNDKMTATAVIKFSGKPTFTPGT